MAGEMAHINSDNPSHHLTDEISSLPRNDNSPVPNGFSSKKSHNSRIQTPNSSGNCRLRRSSRFVDNSGDLGSISKELHSSNLDTSADNSPPLKKLWGGKKSTFFIGEPIPENESQSRWPWRYQENKGLINNRIPSGSKLHNDDDDDDTFLLNAKCHYYQVKVLKDVLDLGDCVYVKGPKGGSNYVGKILEFFESTEGEEYFRVQWFFRTEDTVIKDYGRTHDKRRLFFSTLMNDNPLYCIVSKVKVVQITPTANLRGKSTPHYDFYYDMEYSMDYSTFSTFASDNHSLPSAPHPSRNINKGGMHKYDTNYTTDEISSNRSCEPELELLDMYSGCGGMSTGLCIGAKACGVNLVTRWAVDIDKSACESLRLNHPETQVRNEVAEDFLLLLKKWDSICMEYEKYEKKDVMPRIGRGTDKDTGHKMDHKKSDEYEVQKLVDICFGDPNETGKQGILFKVRWSGYGSSDDTWEPIESLGFCIILHIHQGDVAVICGGPPCQGISGYNRFRNIDSPLDDERNRQIIIFMDVIDFLKPKFVLMENVVDILRFANGCLGRYAISRLVGMHYQTRVGIMAAGCYGLPQFRLRAFLFGAHPHEVLPQFPLPTHDVVIQYGFPSEFERNVVAYDEGQSRNLEKIILLSDAISDLPPVANDEKQDKISYTNGPETAFQKYIRAAECDMMGSPSCRGSTPKKSVLYDHLPYPLGEDDYLRVCQIPKRKGANFRDLPGIVIGPDNTVRRADGMNLMPSGKPWVPDYAINFRRGFSKRPFGRLWWDETVPTIFCVPSPHTRAILHPEQDRLLTLRECARLQGFHDHYRFCGKLKERYSQVGNAVAVSVGRALGYSLGMAAKKLSGDGHLMVLPPNFSHSTTIELLRQQSSEKCEQN